MDTKIIKENERLKISNREKTAQIKELSKALDNIEGFEGIVKNTLNKLKIAPLNVKPLKNYKNNKSQKMIAELMVSDVHYGKETDTFNYKIARKRMQELCRVAVSELDLMKASHKPTELIIALLGDIIENYEMHGLESARGSEGGNPEQVQMAITSLWEDLILPLGVYCIKHKIKLTVPCVTGNHDRTGELKTYHKPGKEHLTWVIYNSLKMLSDQSKLKANFIIPENSYCLYSIFGDIVLYEHGDKFKNNELSIEKHLAKRQKQERQHIEYIRFGHFHSFLMIDRGRAICNMSLPGEDSFSNELGFDSHAGQVLNLYVDSKGKRPNSFYKCFPVYLG